MFKNPDMKKGQLGEWFIAKANPPSVTYAAQTALAVLVSYLIARWFRLPEAYWAPMSTLIVMQSTLSAALPISVQYVAGTAVGAAVGAVTDIYFPEASGRLAEPSLLLDPFASCWGSREALTDTRALPSRL